MIAREVSQSNPIPVQTLNSRPYLRYSTAIMEIGETSKPLIVADLRRDAERLSLEEMRATYGSAFLLHHGGDEALSRPVRSNTTQIVSSVATSGAAGDVPPMPNYLVFPVKSAGRSPYSSYISVGRTPNNDVVIEDASLSKFHAYLRADERGEVTLQDAGSRNGTFVDDVPVRTRERGSAATLHPGARVRFGRVDLVFLRCEELYRLLRAMR
jgi:hypothetical protein